MRPRGSPCLRGTNKAALDPMGTDEARRPLRRGRVGVASPRLRSVIFTFDVRMKLFLLFHHKTVSF